MPETSCKKIVKVGNVEIGGDKKVFIAGPCSIESEEHIMDEAINLKKIGVDILRGGAYKPRTDPNSFQGLGFEGVKYLRRAADEVSIPMVTEVLSEYDIEKIYDYVDIFQVGSRNMYNYALLKRLGKQDKPILLKRGFSASLDEWIKAGEYIRQGGNDKVIFCERGIRTFNDMTRNTLDLAGAVLVQKITNSPVIVDPSHSTGRRDLIKPMTDASIACGLDGVIIEVHKYPDKSISDAKQSIDFEMYKDIVKKYKK